MKFMLFNSDGLVRGIVDGRITMALKYMTKQPDYFYNCIMGEPRPIRNGRYRARMPDGGEVSFGAPARADTTIGVRETWGTYCQNWWEADYFEYKESWKPTEMSAFPPKWIPASYMPKEAVRIFLKVNSVIAKRLHDVTVEECSALGLEANPCWTKNELMAALEEHWNTLYKPKKYPERSFDSNPWVWLIGFEKLPGERMSDLV